MKPTMSKDGIKRINVRIETRLSLDSIAQCFVAANSNSNDIEGLAHLKSKEEILLDVKDQLKNHGVIWTDDKISTENLDDTVLRVINIFEEKFSEFL